MPPWGFGLRGGAEIILTPNPFEDEGGKQRVPLVYLTPTNTPNLVSSESNNGSLNPMTIIMKKTIIVSALLMIILFPVYAYSTLKGDINNDGKVNLQDAIIALQISSGSSVIVEHLTDVDGRIGLAEVIYALQCAALQRDDGSINCELASGHVPALANLWFSPTCATLGQGGGAIWVTGYTDFTDACGDIVNLNLQTMAGLMTVPIAGGSGLTSGLGYGQFLVSTQYLGSFAFDVWVEDIRGNASNKLSGIFRVINENDLGTQWTTRTSGITPQLNNLVWSGAQFVAVGYVGMILTSPDGIHWTKRTSGTNSTLWGVTWTGTQFVAVGEDGTVLTSPDAVTWTQRNIPIEVGNLSFLYDVSWSGTQFVAVGNKVSTSAAEILTSRDGVIWTRTSSEIHKMNNARLYSIAWSGAKFVEVGVQDGDPNKAIIAHSSDGINWTQITLDTYNGLSDIIWTGSQFLAIGYNGIVMASFDGDTWESRSAGALDFRGVAWSGKKFVAVGTRIYTSADGINWTKTSDALGLQGVSWSGSQFVAVGFGGQILTSP